MHSHVDSIELKKLIQFILMYKFTAKEEDAKTIENYLHEYRQRKE